MRRPFFAILGGMGSIATESYIRQLNQAAQAQVDQDFFDYVVFNDAGVYDRTEYILNRSDEDPFPVMADDVRRAEAIGAQFIVLTCNTAHYFFDRLQALTEVPILHMPRLAVQWAQQNFPAEDHPKMMFLGTSGSVKAGVYRHIIESSGYTYLQPSASDQKRVDDLIYREVKSGGRLSDKNYRRLLKEFLDPAGSYKADVVVLGCTELSVLNDAFPSPEMALVDAQGVLVEQTASKARELRQQENTSRREI